MLKVYFFQILLDSDLLYIYLGTGLFKHNVGTVSTGWRVTHETQAVGQKSFFYSPSFTDPLNGPGVFIATFRSYSFYDKL